MSVTLHPWSRTQNHIGRRKEILRALHPCCTSIKLKMLRTMPGSTMNRSTSIAYATRSSSLTVPLVSLAQLLCDRLKKVRGSNCENIHPKLADKRMRKLGSTFSTLLSSILPSLPPSRSSNRIGRVHGRPRAAGSRSARGLHGFSWNHFRHG